MSDEPAEQLEGKSLSTRTDESAPAATIERLQAELARYRAALEEIRDQKFEQANSPRLIDQLWHFVRWSKATARSALEQPGAKAKK